MTAEVLVLYAIAGFLWWKSAELILIDGWTRGLDLRRADKIMVRIVAIFGPVIAAIIWVAWRWADAPEDDETNPIVRKQK